MSTTDQEVATFLLWWANEASTVGNAGYQDACMQAWRAGRAQLLAKLAAQEPVAWLVSLPSGEYVGRTLYFTAPSDPRGFPVIEQPKPLCGQVSNGIACDMPRRGNERLCPDCNPRPAVLAKEQQAIRARSDAQEGVEKESDQHC